ncbi:class I SAM-dependent methyltransferase [Saccharothrix variisporea]|uniref:Methyltransferase family protein n=1 Tax=Saccharothrix variisporea TaxID=543527 RepID=A0A495XMB8_9PSEU|nr:class I SAM-dependent methyltransferase [Saccharothrix variisporea]RKT75052.1 methyltransferase family protein [Saccharothrix variisporea]
MSDELSQVVAAEYRSLDALKTRIHAHRHHSERADDVQQTVLDHSDLNPAHDVLDAGCGTGDFLRSLTATGHTGRLVGLDSSESAVQAVGRLAGVEAVLGDAAALPFPNTSFDRVFARHMLYHVADPAAALESFHRVLRAGGKAIVTVNHEHTLPNVMTLVREEVRNALGTPESTGLNGVHSDNIAPLMKQAFGNARLVRIDNALVFDRPDQLIPFAVAVLSPCGMPADSPAKPAVIDQIATRIHEWFRTHEAPWRDPKGYALCISNREPTPSS